MRTAKGPLSTDETNNDLYRKLLIYLDDAPNWGHAKADELTSPDSPRRDPLRHMMASSEVVQELKNDRGYPTPLAVLAANLLGLGHEVSNFHGVRSMGEDILNNFIGSMPAAVMDDPEKIDKMLEMLSYFIPDGKDESEDDYDQGGRVKDDDPPFDINSLMAGIMRVESSDGVNMMNPTSTATGKYGQLFSEIADLAELDGITREQFAEELGLQDQIFAMRAEGLIPGIPGLIESAFDLTEEYSPQLDSFDYRADEVAALVNYLGRQGTRNYFASLRDGTEYKVPGTNKTPEEYLEEYNVGVASHLEREGAQQPTRTVDTDFKPIKNDKGGRVVKYQHGGRHWPPEGTDAFPPSVATRQDSLDAYDAAQRLQRMVDMWPYETRVETGEDVLQRLADHFRKARGEYTEQEIAIYNELRDQGILGQGRYEGIETIDDYYGVYNPTTDGDVTRVRELTTSVVNPRLPLGYYDTGIQPQGLIRGAATQYLPIVNPREVREVEPSYEQESVGGDIIEFPYYDPIAVKPYDLLTEEEKKERREKYGPEPWEEEKEKIVKVVKQVSEPEPEPEPEPTPQPEPEPDPITERKVRVVKEPIGRQPQYLFDEANTGARGTTRTGQVPYAIVEWNDKRKQWKVRDLSDEEIQEYKDKYEIDFAYGGRVSDKIRVLKKEGKPQKQAVAIALDMLERGKL